jgi:glyoxylase-like metal-dependent hydrolase (beta-lactamase superfamily II)
MFTSFSVSARDGMRVSAPGALNPALGVHVAQSYDFGDFAFIQTSAGVVAIDAGTSPDRVLAAMADLGLKDHAPVSHLILTHLTSTTSAGLRPCAARPAVQKVPGNEATRPPASEGADGDARIVEHQA